MAKPKISHREFLIARAFLRGASGNVQNTYLILAVVAWLRAMNKAHDKYWMGLKRLSADAAGRRLASRLLRKASAGQYQSEYRAILRRLRGKHSKGNAMASQAADFVLGIAKSHWDPKHYGRVEYKAAKSTWVPPSINPSTGFSIPGHWVHTKEVAAKNPLYDAYAALTRSPNIPNSWWITTSKTTTTTTKVRVIAPRPQQPRSLMHVLPEPDYIEPYYVANWYEAKPHYGDNLLLDPD